MRAITVWRRAQYKYKTARVGFSQAAIAVGAARRFGPRFSVLDEGHGVDCALLLLLDRGVKHFASTSVKLLDPFVG
jgi:hypothetical protein